jgi:hypothetical protein
MTRKSEDSRYEFFDYEPRNGFAITAYEEGLVGCRLQDTDFQTAAMGTEGGRVAGGGFLRVGPGRVGNRRLLGVQFEGAAAFGANMIEAALGFTGVDDILTAALRTTDNLFQRGEAHGWIVRQLDILTYARSA